MPYFTLDIMEKPFCIHRFSPDAPFPVEIIHSMFFFVTRFAGELSLILPEDISIQSSTKDSDWVCIKAKILPHYDASAMIAHISAVLAEKGICMYIFSTGDAHYILVKIEQLIIAKKALENAQCRFSKVQ